MQVLVHAAENGTVFQNETIKQFFSMFNWCVISTAFCSCSEVYLGRYSYL